MSKIDVNPAGVPPAQFWEDDLELSREHILRQVQHDTELAAWINGRTGRQLAILGNAIGINDKMSTKKLKAKIRTSKPDILGYVLVERFSHFKARVAVIDFAARVLPAKTIEACQMSDTEYDKVALLFAIFQHRWSDLRLIFHLDKIHKAGFARMILKGKMRRPRGTFRDFLRSSQVGELLACVDSSREDGRASELKAVTPLGESNLVFIRRPNRPKHLVGLQGGVIHAYDPEWIILDFRDNGSRVRIASTSISLPLEIANRMASAYYGKDREYENEAVVTYGKQVERFFSQVRDTRLGDLVLVELQMPQSPLKGSSTLKISRSDARSIADSLYHFEQAVGKLRVEQIEEIKVLFRQKRVSLFFRQSNGSADEFEVRYSDHRLNAIERIDFEEYMRKVHGITVLSTEKRFKKRPQRGGVLVARRTHGAVADKPASARRKRA